MKVQKDNIFNLSILLIFIYVLGIKITLYYKDIYFNFNELSYINNFSFISHNSFEELFLQKNNKSNNLPNKIYKKDKFNKYINYFRIILKKGILYNKEDIFKCYDEKNKRNRCIIFTCSSGGYDNIKNVTIIQKGFDFKAFVDKVDYSSTWELNFIPKNLDYLDNIRRCRYIKTHPHLFFKNYDLSFYIDANLEIVGDLYDFIELYVDNNYTMYFYKHPTTKDTYQEFRDIYISKYEKKEMIDKVRERYKKEGFPHNYGMAETKLIIRKHNEVDCIDFMNDWWEQIENYSHRDQMSFDYIRWKKKAKIKFLINTRQVSPYVVNSYYHSKDHTMFKQVVKKKFI